MNEQNNYQGGQTPYRANGNINNIIENPSMNVNDTMNVNIQNVDPNQMQGNYSQQNQNQGANYVSTPNNSYTNNIINDNYQSDFQNQNFVTVDDNVTYTRIESTQDQTQNPNGQKKKNTMTVTIGAEFKIAFLIVAVLLVFVMLFLN